MQPIKMEFKIDFKRILGEDPKKFMHNKSSKVGSKK